MPGQRPWAFPFVDSNDRNIIITDNILQNLVSDFKNLIDDEPNKIAIRLKFFLSVSRLDFIIHKQAL
jgi:hypothetical protein